MIGDHPWYVYVDPEINVFELQFVSEVLDDDYKFLEALLSGNSQPNKQTEQQHNVSESQQQMESVEQSQQYEIIRAS